MVNFLHLQLQIVPIPTNSSKCFDGIPILEEDTSATDQIHSFATRISVYAAVKSIQPTCDKTMEINKERTAYLGQRDFHR